MGVAAVSLGLLCVSAAVCLGLAVGREAPVSGEPVTVFSAVRGLSDSEESVRVRNAVLSWWKSGLGVREVVLVVEDERARCMELLGDVARCLEGRECVAEEIGRPRINCVWGLVHEVATTSRMLFVSSDVVLVDGLGDAVREAETELAGESFVLVGRRTDVFVGENQVVPELGNSNDFWRKELKMMASQKGIVHSDFGLDYWVYHRENICTDCGDVRSEKGEKVVFPGFIIGLLQWDNYLLSEFIRHERIATIDASERVLAVHQDKRDLVPQKERMFSSYNRRLRRGISRKQMWFGNLNNTDYRFANGKIVPVRNRPEEIPILLAKTISSKFVTFLVPVWESDIEASMKWIEMAKELSLNNVLLIPMDMHASVALESAAITLQKSMAYSKELGLTQLEFVLSFLEAGMNYEFQPFLMHPETRLARNPLPSLYGYTKRATVRIAQDTNGPGLFFGSFFKKPGLKFMQEFRSCFLDGNSHSVDTFAFWSSIKKCLSIQCGASRSKNPEYSCLYLPKKEFLSL